MAALGVQGMDSLSDKLKVYTATTYFVTTIFSTVGFGDIGMELQAEAKVGERGST